LWVTDLIGELGVHPHDAPFGSILLLGDYLYLCTSNGVDASHKFMPAPEAPSLAVLEKATGRIVAVDGENMGPRTVHCTWSSPSYANVEGRDLIFFGGGDGVVYAFEPFSPNQKDSGEIALLKRVWRFDCDPTAPKENVHDYKGNKVTSPSNIYGMPVFASDQVFIAAGGDLWHGKNEAWLKCIDASQTGTITKSGEVWSYPLERHVMSTPAVSGDLVFIGDCGRHVHCVDRKTGEGLWKHYAEAEIWGSPMVVDGKVFIGTKKGDLWVFAAQPEKEILGQIDMKAPIQGTPTAANQTLYVATMNRLYAISESGESGMRPERP
ncbi:MAG: PQQ-binding-like beta-propeller repeat protein, partial [Candidatus Omnitrophica bacterium]|nr:PQQ-binding-like beta-propeller repeat protein [Candidatus Omnitrophota bacterium]